MSHFSFAQPRAPIKNEGFSAVAASRFGRRLRHPRTGQACQFFDFSRIEDAECELQVNEERGDGHFKTWLQEDCGSSRVPCIKRSTFIWVDQTSYSSIYRLSASPGVSVSLVDCPARCSLRIQGKSILHQYLAPKFLPPPFGPWQPQLAMQRQHRQAVRFPLELQNRD
jgi:hypothetical protein